MAEVYLNKYVKVFLVDNSGPPMLVKHCKVDTIRYENGRNAFVVLNCALPQAVILADLRQCELHLQYDDGVDDCEYDASKVFATMTHLNSIRYCIANLAACSNEVDIATVDVSFYCRFCWK